MVFRKNLSSIQGPGVCASRAFLLAYTWSAPLSSRYEFLIRL
jgi:hypothetical protein